jgi:protein-disulfide isomerase
MKVKPNKGECMSEKQEKQSIRDAETVSQSETTRKEKGEKRVKDLVPALIVLLGLFVGSVFVDVAQLAAGEGVSHRALSKSDMFELGGKTWVAFEEPSARVSVITDDSCEKCDPSQVLVFLRRYLPTMLAENVAASSDAGKAIIERANIQTLPALVFDSSVRDTTFFLQAEQLFQPSEDESIYTLDAVQLGLPVGKYLELPSVNEEDIVVGAVDAPVTIVEFSDFECPYCAMLHPAIRQALEAYEGKVRFVYKHLPLSFHAQAENAALASECANEQGKFWEYADTLFENQGQWSETEGTASFKRYAANLGLNTTTFNQCLDSAKYQDKIDADIEEAQKFGISGTPGTFVGEQFLGGASSFETLATMIEDELGSEK